MAFTPDEKAQIRRYLGWPDINRQYDLALEAAMDAVSTEGEGHVRTLLTELAGIETALKDGHRPTLKITEVVGDVKLAGRAGLRAMWDEGNRLAYQIGDALNLIPQRLPFSRGSGGGATARG